MTGKIPQERNDLRQAWSWKRGWWTLAPRLWQSLSPHSVCRKSPNLLAALLPLPDLSLKLWQRWVRLCAGKGRFPRAIRPKKECIKLCETCFANTLNLNDNGPSLKWVCFPKSFIALLTLTQNKPSEFFVCYLLFDPYCLTWLMSFPIFLCKLNPIKAHWGKGSWPFSFERLAAFSPQADRVLVDLFSSTVARGGWWGPAGGAPPHHPIWHQRSNYNRIVKKLLFCYKSYFIGR